MQYVPLLVGQVSLDIDCLSFLVVIHILAHLVICAQLHNKVSLVISFKVSNYVYFIEITQFIGGSIGLVHWLHHLNYFLWLNLYLSLLFFNFKSL